MIRPLFCYTLIAGALVVPCAHAQDAQAVIKTAEYALGMIRGPQRIDAINTIEYWGTGSIYTAGQAGNPGSARREFKTMYHASLSYAVPGMRVDVTRSNPDGPAQGGGGLPLAAPQRQIQVVSGRFAWNESVPGAGFIAGSTATPTPDAVRDRLLQLWMTPFGVLKMAVKAGSAAKVAAEAGATVITFPLSGALEGITAKATLNAKNQVERVETRTVRGDMVTETSYSDYKDLSEITTDVPFPSHIVEKQGGFPALDLTITKADTNNPYVVFPVPDNVEKAPSAVSGAGR
jgi:hypothetical protein